MKTTDIKRIELTVSDIRAILHEKFADGKTAQFEFHVTCDSSNDFYGGPPSYIFSGATVIIEK